jgi:hypothetical protein
MSEKISSAEYRALVSGTAKPKKATKQKQISTTKAEAIAGILEKAYDCIRVRPPATGIVDGGTEISFELNGYRFEVILKQI